ncbi:hypothetical protein GGQ85_003514 [Nitrobacter vulgaris]|nr:hypothetical protein [Nitrobacter vulgaris]MDR6305789.1 hypothetical protein [Nitrobacter vulgaris]
MLQPFPAVWVPNQVDDLMIGGYLAWQRAKVNVGNNNGENRLAQLLGEQELVETPARRDPLWRDQKQHGLTSISGSRKRLTPELAWRQAGLWI